MATINFTCPHCKEKATILEDCDFNVTEQFQVDSLRLINGHQPANQGGPEVLAETNWVSENGEEIRREFVETRGYSCSKCGESLGDDEGDFGSPERLAAWLESQGMLIRVAGEPSGEFDVPDEDDRDDQFPPG